MGFAIHEQATKKQMFYDPSKPQERVPDPLPENWMGTASRGLPVREIPHYDFPCVLYMWPNRPFQEIEHRNNNFELVGTETVPTEHLTRRVHCSAHANGGPKDCADCNKELESALADGWRKEPYIPKAPDKPNSDLYGPPRSKK